ncbi:MAG: hypothetical protein AAGH76_05555 [Pseudomonadota bacterium]
MVTRRPGPDPEPDQRSELELLMAALRVETVAIAPAAIRAAALGRAASAATVCIDAVCLGASLDDLYLQGRPADLGTDTAAALAQLIATTAGDRLTDITIDSLGFGLATVADGAAPRGIDPARAHGVSLRRTPIRDRPAALATLDAELQMTLHNWAGNDERQARGQVPINALWLWGAGNKKPPTSTGLSLPFLVTDDLTLTAFWQLTGNAAKRVVDWREVIGAGDEAVIVPRDAADLSAIIAAARRRSRWRSWRNPLTLYDTDFATLPLSEWQAP